MITFFFYKYTKGQNEKRGYVILHRGRERVKIGKKGRKKKSITALRKDQECLAGLRKGPVRITDNVLLRLFQGDEERNLQAALLSG